MVVKKSDEDIPAAGKLPHRFLAHFVSNALNNVV
jgi:hypothetical protein